MIVDYHKAVRAIAFDGLASYAEMVRPAALTGLAAWSVSVWVRWNSLPSLNPTRGIVGSAEAVAGFSLDKAGGNSSYALRAVFAGAGTKTLFTTGYTFTTGVWDHLLLSYDGATLRGYLNGTVLANPPAVAADTLSWGSETALRLARRATAYASADLADLSFWSAAITPATVRGTGGTAVDLYGASGLLLWWPLGDRYRLGSYSLASRAGTAPAAAWSWVNAVEATQVVTR